MWQNDLWPLQETFSSINVCMYRGAGYVSSLCETVRFLWETRLHLPSKALPGSVWQKGLRRWWCVWLDRKGIGKTFFLPYCNQNRFIFFVVVWFFQNAPISQLTHEHFTPVGKESYKPLVRTSHVLVLNARDSTLSFEIIILSHPWNSSKHTFYVVPYSLHSVFESLVWVIQSIFGWPYYSKFELRHYLHKPPCMFYLTSLNDAGVPW